MKSYELNYKDIVMINLWSQQIIEEKVKPTEGIRDYNLLMSIPESINQSFSGQELYPTVYDKSAYLWYSLSRYHCFIDGNKRTALLTTIVYLIINGYSIKTYMEDLYETCINIASGNMTICQISMYLAENTMADIEYNEYEINNILSSLSKIDSLILVIEKLGR
jgi:death on curing protein